MISRNIYCALFMLTSFCVIAFGCSKNDPTSFDTETTTGSIDWMSGHYETIKIGNQWWMAENLHTNGYRNGDVIYKITDSLTWLNARAGALCVYDNISDISYWWEYGYLYNWHATKNTRGIAPPGWHIPSKEEWDILIAYLGGIDNAGRVMKEAGLTHWKEPNPDASNESGFTALPSGLRSDIYEQFGETAIFWTATESDEQSAICISLSYENNEVLYSVRRKEDGLSIRCVKDAE